MSEHEESTLRWWAKNFTVPILVALIGLAGVIFTALVSLHISTGFNAAERDGAERTPQEPEPVAVAVTSTALPTATETQYSGPVIEEPISPQSTPSPSLPPATEVQSSPEVTSEALPGETQEPPPDESGEEDLAGDRIPLTERLNADESSFQSSTNEWQSDGLFDKKMNEIQDCWSSDDGDLEGAWVQWELEQRSTVTEIRVWQGVPTVFNDREYWPRVRDAALVIDGSLIRTLSLTSDDGWQHFSIEPMSASTIRIVFETLHDGHLPRLVVCEVEVFGHTD